MKKKLILIMSVVLVLIVFCVTGCKLTKNQNSNSNTSRTLTAEVAETAQKSFGLEKVGEQKMEDTGFAEKHIAFYRETSTDVMYIAYERMRVDAGCSISVMMNPETGLPLTYKDWVSNYKNK